MAKAPITETIAAELTVPERVLLFCLASGTDWAKAGVTHKGDIALPNVNGVGLRRNPEPEITLRSASLLWRR